ncbi:MAG: hypothetical protein ACTSRZ_16980 [Promethearchaeota archaeon]
MDIDFDLSKLDLGIPIRELGLITIVSFISLIFNFGAFDQDSTQYIYMALHYINQPPLEFIVIASHIAILNTFVRLIRPVVPFLAGWLNNIIYLGNIPPFSFSSGFWQLPFGIVNSIFSFMSSIVLYKLIFHFTESPKKSVFGVVLYNFCDIMFFNSMILIEGATLFFAIFMVYLIICRPFEDSYLNSIIIGITIGLAGLTKETLLVSGIVLFLGYSIYRIKDLFEIEKFKKFLLAGILVIAVYGSYVLSIGLMTYFACLYVFFNLNLSNLLALVVPQPILSRIPQTTIGIGESMINLFRYTLIFFVLGLINIFISEKTREDKILISLYLIAFFIPLIFSPFVVERFLFPFYLVSTYVCIEGIYAVDENKYWVLSIIISIAVLNLIYVIFFYPYTLLQQFSNVGIRTFLYYLIFVYLGASLIILLYKHVISKRE